MTVKDSRLFHGVRTTNDFLLAQTETISPADNHTGRLYPKATKRNYIATHKISQTALAKRQFCTMAIDALSSHDNIIAMAVQLDGKDDRSDPSMDMTNGGTMAATMDTFCAAEKGFWGVLNPSTFGCFLPGNALQSADAKAKQIRNLIATAASETVTIGIAPYPMGDFERTDLMLNACKALDHAAFFGPDSTVIFDDISLNISGDNLFQAGDIRGAITEFQTALGLNGTNTNVQNSLGVCYGLLGEYASAIDAFQATTTINPDEYMAFYNLGLVYMIKEDFKRALDYFQKAYGVKEDVFEIALQTGRMHFALNEVHQAKEIILKAIDLNGMSSLGFRLLGDCYAALDMPADAISAYKQAVKLHPNDANALSALGALYGAENKNTEIAFLYCEKSIELAPTEGLFHERLGRLYRKHNRIDEATRSFQTAAKLGRDVQETVTELQQQQKTA